MANWPRCMLGVETKKILGGATVKTRLFDFQFCTALLALLVMPAECMSLKRPVLRFTVAIFFLLKLFSSHLLYSKKDFVIRKLSVRMLFGTYGRVSCVLPYNFLTQKNLLVIMTMLSATWPSGTARR